MSAHLAGVTASLTTLPVLGVPTESKLKGFSYILRGLGQEAHPVLGLSRIRVATTIPSGSISRRMTQMLIKPVP